MPASSRLSSSERRTAILNAAIRLFAGRGFRGVTTRELAASVGVSEPVLYQHFPSKKELYDAIIEASMDQAYYDALSGLEHAAATADDREFFLHLAQEMVCWHRNRPELIRLKMFAALEGHELMDSFHDNQARPFVSIIVGFIQRRIEEGVFRPVNPLGAAATFCGSVAHYCNTTLIFRSTLLRVDEPEMIELMVDLFLNGIRNPK
jgi:AcrR family transcriptional regulator